MKNPLKIGILSGHSMLRLEIVCNCVLLMFSASFHRHSEESCTEQQHSGWFRHDDASWCNRKTWSIETGVRNRPSRNPTVPAGTKTEVNNVPTGFQMPTVWPTTNPFAPSSYQLKPVTMRVVVTLNCQPTL